MRILLAEDDSVLADGLTRSLRQSGYVTDCVNTGQAADNALSTQDFDLLILDLDLPIMSGLEVQRRLRCDKDASRQHDVGEVVCVTVMDCDFCTRRW